MVVLDMARQEARTSKLPTNRRPLLRVFDGLEGSGSYCPKQTRGTPSRAILLRQPAASAPSAPVTGRGVELYTGEAMCVHGTGTKGESGF